MKDVGSSRSSIQGLRRHHHRAQGVDRLKPILAKDFFNAEAMKEGRLGGRRQPLRLDLQHGGVQPDLQGGSAKDRAAGEGAGGVLQRGQGQPAHRGGSGRQAAEDRTWTTPRTPTTVSRGIIFVNAKDVGYKPFLDSWMALFNK